jgi:hypothetical protein
MVIQRETTGQRLDPETQRVNPPTISAAKAVATPPPGLGLSLDNYRVERYGTTDSALIWTFQYSNDRFFNLGTTASGTNAIPNGNLTGTSFTQPIAYPALLVVPIELDTDGDSVPETVPTYQRIVLNPHPEQLSTWKVKTTTNAWNANVQSDIAERVGTMHHIAGGWWLFNGATSFRQISETNYDVTYEWIKDAGNSGIGIASSQDPTLRLILPPKVPALVDGLPNPVLSKGFGPAFEGDKFVRLPYHRVTLGQTTDPLDQPPFIQFTPYTFSDSNRLDWQQLPGDPITAAGGG